MMFAVRLDDTVPLGTEMWYRRPVLVHSAAARFLGAVSYYCCRPYVVCAVVLDLLLKDRQQLQL